MNSFCTTCIRSFLTVNLGVLFISFIGHSLDIQQWQVLIGEVEKLGPVSPVAILMSVDLAHSGGPLLHISTIFIWEPKNLWFKDNEPKAK